MDALRLRLEEKETMLNKKTKQIQDMSEEKGTQAGEIHDLKDMLDVKERKVSVLQKKVRRRCSEPRALCVVPTRCPSLSLIPLLMLLQVGIKTCC